MILCKVNRLLYKPSFIRPLIRFTHDDYAKVLYPLESRKVLKVSGPESSAFLQGLVTNDMNQFAEGAQSMYAMFLNGKGRILYDTLIHKWVDDNVFLVECDKCVIQLLKKHLKVYKLKRQVHIGDISSLFKVWALIPPYNTDVEILNDIHCNINIYKDPRLPELGYRLITTNNVDQFDLQEVVGKDTVMESNENGYKYLRYRLGISEGADDLFPGTSLPQEANCDYLHGVSFQKGCYIGQELLARVHHTGVVRKRMMPLKFNNTTKAEGLERDAEILAVEDGTTAVGKLKSYAHDYGLGLIRIKEALEAKSLSVGPYNVNIAKPSWWPEEASREKINVIKPQREQNENF